MIAGRDGVVGEFASLAPGPVDTEWVGGQADLNNVADDVAHDLVGAADRVDVIQAAELLGDHRHSVVDVVDQERPQQLNHGRTVDHGVGGSAEIVVALGVAENLIEYLTSGVAGGGGIEVGAVAGDERDQLVEDLEATEPDQPGQP